MLDGDSRFCFVCDHVMNSFSFGSSLCHLVFVGTAILLVFYPFFTLDSSFEYPFLFFFQLFGEKYFDFRAEKSSWN